MPFMDQVQPRDYGPSPKPCVKKCHREKCVTASAAVSGCRPPGTQNRYVSRTTQHGTTPYRTGLTDANTFPSAMKFLPYSRGVPLLPSRAPHPHRISISDASGRKFGHLQVRMLDPGRGAFSGGMHFCPPESLPPHCSRVQGIRPLPGGRFNTPPESVSGDRH